MSKPIQSPIQARRKPQQTCLKNVSPVRWVHKFRKTETEIACHYIFQGSRTSMQKKIANEFKTVLRQDFGWCFPVVMHWSCVIICITWLVYRDISQGDKNEFWHSRSFKKSHLLQVMTRTESTSTCRQHFPRTWIKTERGNCAFLKVSDLKLRLIGWYSPTDCSFGDE